MANTKWMLNFFDETTQQRAGFVRDFPNFLNRHPNVESWTTEANRVFTELELSGDTHEWAAYGCPDPSAVGIWDPPGISVASMVQPSSDANVSVVLPIRDCGTTGAVCTSDNITLTNRLDLTVQGSDSR